MQSIAKQVTLALTATHKTVKSRGYLAVTLAWVQKAGINGVRDKVLVWLELRNTQHDLWYIPSQNTSGKKTKKNIIKLSKCSQPLDGELWLTNCLLEAKLYPQCLLPRLRELREEKGFALHLCQQCSCF